jgi:hypothetical protein
MNRLAAALTALLVSSPVRGRAEPLVTEADAGKITAAARRVMANTAEWRFLVVEDPPTGRFVQFAAEGERLIADFPVGGATTARRAPRVRMAGCSERPIARSKDEVPVREPTWADEGRLVKALDAMHVPWKKIFCRKETPEGRRAGHIASIQASLTSPDAAPAFVERIFAGVYGAEHLGPLHLITDAD